MNIEEILSHVDYTLLKPYCTFEEIKEVCDYGIAHKTASVCIPPSFVKAVKNLYGDQIKICTVIGFPLGYNTKETKVFETKEAIKNGADEIDMVINIGDAKSNKFEKILSEIKSIKEVCNQKKLKVIVETCYLSDNEKIKLCECINNSGADYIKTSTGFGLSGAEVLDIELFKKHINDNVKIKAAGGIRTKESMEKFLELGCDRIGTSAKINED